MRTLVAYVPVLHEGYRRFFEKYEGPKELFIFGSEFIEPDRELSRDIRQLNPELMQKAIEALGIFDRVDVLDIVKANEFNHKEREVILPDELVSRELAQIHFPEAQVSFDPIFLRWDKHNALAEKPIVPDERITRDEFHQRIMSQAQQESLKSSDNWRQVGAAIVKNGEVILTAYNRHVPSEHTPYVHGDPRNNFRRGINIEISSALHAEAGLIAEAARKGISLEGADMYVTVFPCPPCAKMIAYSGIKNFYCGGGYGVLDGEDILKTVGIKTIFVE